MGKVKGRENGDIELIFVLAHGDEQISSIAIR